MDLNQFLAYLHTGACSSFQILTAELSNADLKSLRLICKGPTSALFPLLFTRVYLSSHEEDLEVFRHISSHDLARRHVEEIIWDDTTFDTALLEKETYKQRLEELKPTDRRRFQENEFDEAFSFWRQSYYKHKAIRDSRKDIDALGSALDRFPNLRFMTLMSRSRLTYVESSAYWQVWQTPRSRQWRMKPCYHLLLDPEPFKPHIGTTVERSEGVRAVRAIRRHLMTTRGLRIGSLVVESIGGGQSRASGGMTSNRYDRKWHIDLRSLTAQGKSSFIKTTCLITLHIFLETQTQNLWRDSDGIWEHEIWSCITQAKYTLRELTLSAMCLDSFWGAIQAQVSLNDFSESETVLSRCFTLRKLVFRNCWCSTPLPLLRWLRVETRISHIEFNYTDIESASWQDVLMALRREKLLFDQFEVIKCRSPGETSGWQGTRSWNMPWSGKSADIVPWLRGESTNFPLRQ